MIDTGTGPAVVLVPGIQGRWEWMRPAIDALSRRCRVISYSLCGDRGSRTGVDTKLGFDSFLNQIDDLLDRAGLRAAAICGVSYGGLIALRYAARRRPRVESLVLVSTPSPTWRPGCRVEWYIRLPRLLAPAFVAQSPGRLWPEIAAASGRWRPRLAFALRHTTRVMAAPFSPVRMAERIRLLEGIDFAADCAAVTARTLVVTGEPRLDRIVPVESTRQFLHALPGSIAYATIERTGHIGLISRPERFATIVAEFVAPPAGHQAERRRA